MKAKKKPIVLDVWQIDLTEKLPPWVRYYAGRRKIQFPYHDFEVRRDRTVIRTLEGKMEADVGDYIVKGTKNYWRVSKCHNMKM
ncbi:hypothetical protein ACJQWY_02300 [Weissella kandleri]|uniref:hypothetical protein n=1 Tax=Weissella kandleri TaxID=1616 RepID=UPI00387E2E05